MPVDYLIVANWKMYKTPEEAEIFWRVFHEKKIPSNIKVVICPTFLSISNMVNMTQHVSNVQIGAQDGHWYAEGANTGNVSMSMLRQVGVTHVIVGHSERRIQHEEGDDFVQRKVAAAREHGLIPIICVGERIEDRLAGKANDVVRIQVERALATISAAGLSDLIIAYEPVWSIRTGQAASEKDAFNMALLIKSVLQTWGEEAMVDNIPVLYGGSVEPGNVNRYMKAMSGVLVGRMSLEPDAFYELILAASQGKC